MSFLFSSLDLDLYYEAHIGNEEEMTYRVLIRDMSNTKKAVGYADDAQIQFRFIEIIFWNHIFNKSVWTFKVIFIVAVKFNIIEIERIEID